VGIVEVAPWAANERPCVTKGMDISTKFHAIMGGLTHSCRGAAASGNESRRDGGYVIREIRPEVAERRTCVFQQTREDDRLLLFIVGGCPAPRYALTGDMLPRSSYGSPHNTPATTHTAISHDTCQSTGHSLMRHYGTAVFAVPRNIASPSPECFDDLECIHVTCSINSVALTFAGSPQKFDAKPLMSRSWTKQSMH
jgi:hypothetical protein